MKQEIPEIHPTEVEEYLNRGYQLIDVRTEEEFVGELSHIKQSKLVSLGLTLDAFLDSLDKSEKVIFVCRSGGRSGKATEKALKAGFRNILNMQGGMLLWNEMKLEVV